MTISPRNRVMPRIKKSAVRPSQEDYDLLVLMTRYRYATVPQIQRLHAPTVTSQAVYKRLKRLQNCGLVTARTHGIPRGMYALYIPSPAAYDWVMSDLHPEQAVSLASLEHTLAVCDVSASYRTYESTSGRIWTEREIASAVYQWRRERDAKKPQQSVMPGLPARPVAEQPDGPFLCDRYGRTHAPDMVVMDEDGQWHAIEVELTMKSPNRLAAIWSMYSNDTRFASVTYWAPPAVKARIETLAAEAMIPGLTIQVYRYEPLHSIQPERRVQGQQAA